MTPERDPFDVFIMAMMVTVVVLAVAVLAAWVVIP